MADRYWVGGTGSWTTSSTTNWSATSGGASGASVPTATDSVFFDQAGTYTVTLTGALTCLDFNVSAGAITFTSTGTPTISGSMTVTNVTPTWTATGTITFNATSGKTVTTNGTLFAASFLFGGANTVYTLGSSLTSTSSTVFDIISGPTTLNTAGYALSTAGSIRVYSGSVLTLGASTVTVSNNFALSLNPDGVVNAGTSQINCTGTGIVFLNSGAAAAGVRTFYNVAFTGVSATFNQAINITGSNTFNNLSFVGGNVYRLVTIAANQTINGVLSTSGTAGNNRVVLASSTTGMQRDLAVNGTPSLTDIDFRDIRVTGTAAPISGTRLGNQGGCSGITFSTPKTVYWNLAAGGNWTVNAWAATSGGATSTDNFPLPQDTAVIGNTGLNTSATVTVNVALAIGTLDISGRTTAMTLATSTQLPTILGDLKLSTSVTLSGTGAITFAGRKTQTITSAGRPFTQPITIDSIGGTVQLADALNITGNTLTVTNGTFDTKNFNVSAGQLLSNNSNVRTINLGSSTITFSGVTAFEVSNITNLTFNAGTSQINFNANFPSLLGPTTPVNSNLIFNNVSYTNASSGSQFSIDGLNTFNNLTILPPSTGIIRLAISNNQTINGTFTVAGASSIRRVFVRSNTLGITRTLTVNSLSATNCDFRDITIAGAAAGSSPTRAGDCGGNSGITFPAAKTVYWNLAGVQNWSATGWALSSGGTPDINNFPLAQDTAVFDDAGSAGTVTINAAWNIGTFNASTRTSAMTFNPATSTTFYGNFLYGTGVTVSSSANTLTFSGRGTQTITSNGVTFTCPVTIDSVTGTVQLADALTLSSTRVLSVQSGVFNAVSYNVTIGGFSSSSYATGTGVTGATAIKSLKMGSGLWTISGVGTVWSLDMSTYVGADVFDKGTANIILSDTSSTARTFNAISTSSYNKLTIGGATGTSTTTISAGGTTPDVQFTELASTKTVAHTIAFGGTGGSFRFGAWTVTGTVGNVVTVTGTGVLSITGARVSGVDYLAMGTNTISTTSPVEFYAGANSTGTGLGVILTAAPTPVTRYWRGGTGTWNATTTTNWSATSGGAGGASVPTSADTVIFDSASNATAYTVTLTATQLRCAILSISGPAAGNITFSGTAPLSITQALAMASTGITRTYTGAITFGGTGSGKTISAGQTLASTITINGVGASWALTGAISTSSSMTLTNGSFNTAGFALTCSLISTSLRNSVTLSFGTSAITLSTGLDFTGTATVHDPVNLTFNSGTSSLTFSASSPTFYHGGRTFYDATFGTVVNVNPINLGQGHLPLTFRNLSFGPTSSIRNVFLATSLNVTGTLTFAAGSATIRYFIQSGVVGIQRTLNVAALSGFSDVDFCDINCQGTASWSSGTRIGDCGGNGGSFVGSTPKTVYWNLAAGGNWSATAWATSSGGTPDINNFPLAQDTATIVNTGLNTSAAVSVNANWNIGTVDMSGRTTAMTFATGSNNPAIYGDFKFGPGVTSSGTASLYFSKRGTQTITSNGRTFTQPVYINSGFGTVQLADALITNLSITLNTGNFNAVSYNVTCTTFSSGVTSTRILSMGSGLWTLTGTGVPWNLGSTNLTFNKGTANIIVTDTTTSARQFTGGSLTYNKLTIGGATGSSTFTITGNNTFSEIASTKTVAHTLSLGSTTQTVAAFTAAGRLNNLFTITGTSVTSPATLIYTGGSSVDVSYIVPTFLRVYTPFVSWTATNSTNGGTYGFIWVIVVIVQAVKGQFFAFF